MKILKFGNQSKKLSRPHVNTSVPIDLAMTLLDAYDRQLAPLTGKTTDSSKEQEGALKATLKLLMGQGGEQAQRNFAQRMLLVIFHKKHWLSLHPDNYVLPASKWFDPTCKKGILADEKLILKRI